MVSVIDTATTPVIRILILNHMFGLNKHLTKQTDQKAIQNCEWCIQIKVYDRTLYRAFPSWTLESGSSSTDKKGFSIFFQDVFYHTSNSHTWPEWLVAIDVKISSSSLMWPTWMLWNCDTIISFYGGLWSNLICIQKVPILRQTPPASGNKIIGEVRLKSWIISDDIFRKSEIS